MKQKLCVLFFLFVSFFVNAKSDWDFEQFSVLFGGVVMHETSNLYTFEIDWDRGIKNAIPFPLYFGFGANASTSYLFREYGIKAYYNLVVLSIGVSRSYRLFPYVFAQQNYKKYRIENPPFDPRFLLKTGVGFSGVSITRSERMFRSGFQIAYNVTQSELKPIHRFSMELKVGFSLRIDT